MQLFINILTCGVILFSCSERRIEKLKGSWKLDYDGQTQSLLSPFELCFQGDSLVTVDGNNFKVRVQYEIKGDSVELIFSNGSIRKMYFNLYSDSILFFGHWRFHTVADSLLNTVNRYDLIDYKTDEILIDSAYSGVIHLVKNGRQVQVILNDVTTDLKYIPNFLATYHGASPTLLLYIGKGLEFAELVEVYMWLKVASINRVTLVTGNDAFDKFYVARDYISIDDSLMNVFLKKENVPPFPLSPIELMEKERNIIKISNQTDFEKLTTINDSTEYLIQVNIQLNLSEYMELIGKVNDKKNIRKVVTPYMK